VNDREKLKSLLHHWREHNHEHAAVYHEWAIKVSSHGDEELSKILLTLSRETRKLDEIIEKALKIV
jgi:hypothetical protein